MPFISVTTANDLCFEQMEALRREFQTIITTIPGKKPKSIMTSFSTNNQMFFGDEPKKSCAYVSISSYGPINIELKKTVTEKMCVALENTAGIPRADIFLTYSEFENWGVGGVLL